MPKASFDSLPEDILVVILSKSNPVSVRRCHQVNRILRKIISTDHYLQYLLELESCGYVEPCCPRSDLSYTEKAQILRNHKLQWDDPTKIVPAHHKLPDYNRQSVKLAKGTCTWRVQISMEWALFQLPSINRGTELKTWSINPGTMGLTAAIEPDQDLIAILDDCGTIHLLSATTGQHHPKAAVTPIMCLGEELKTIHMNSSARLELVDSHLVGVFCQKTSMFYTMIIWNWSTGCELVRHVIEGNDHIFFRTFDFLSEDIFVICRQFDSTHGGLQPSQKRALGLLDVYQFDPLADAPSAAKLLVSLELPPHQPNATPHNSYIFFSSSLYASQSCRAQIWDISPDDRTLCITFRSFQSGDYASNLLVPSYVLQELAYNNKGAAVAWDNWSFKACWEESSGTHLSWNDSVEGYGRRLAIMRYRPSLTFTTTINFYHFREGLTGSPKTFGCKPSTVEIGPGAVRHPAKGFTPNLYWMNMNDENTDMLSGKRVLTDSDAACIQKSTINP
ncbi:hypothetical protein RhiJN_21052 [Ceratobasidium sp. AG-Ba]|nr:hypothetical protein RhiJN_21052 [Ceratobasidium sp. AG-Ba]